MNYNRKAFFAVFTALAVLTPAAFVLRLFILFGSVDGETGFFTNSPVPCILYNILAFIVLGSLLIIGNLFRGKKEKPAEKIEENADSVAADLEKTEPDFLFRQSSGAREAERRKSEEASGKSARLTGISRIAVTWNGTLSCFSQILCGIFFLVSALFLCPVDGEAMANDEFILAVFSAVSGACILLNAVLNKSKYISWRFPLSFAPVIWCAARMVAEYRDLMKYANKTLYVAPLLYLISVMLFFLYQSQKTLDTDFDSPSGLYLATGCAAVYFGISSQLAQAFFLASDRFQADTADAGLLMLDLCITFYILMKIVTVQKKAGKTLYKPTSDII